MSIVSYFVHIFNVAHFFVSKLIRKSIYPLLVALNILIEKACVVFFMFLYLNFIARWLSFNFDVNYLVEYYDNPASSFLVVLSSSLIVFIYFLYCCFIGALSICDAIALFLIYITSTNDDMIVYEQFRDRSVINFIPGAIENIYHYLYNSYNCFRNIGMFGICQIININETNIPSFYYDFFPVEVLLESFYLELFNLLTMHRLLAISYNLMLIVLVCVVFIFFLTILATNILWFMFENILYTLYIALGTLICFFLTYFDIEATIPDIQNYFEIWSLTKIFLIGQNILIDIIWTIIHGWSFNPDYCFKFEFIWEQHTVDNAVYGLLQSLDILVDNFLNKLTFTRKCLFMEFLKHIKHTMIYCFYMHVEAFFFFLFFFVFVIILSLIYSSKLSFYGIFFINFFGLFCFWLYTLYNFNYFILQNGVLYINLWKWFVLWGNLPVYFDIYIDSLSYSYILLVLTIAVGVNLYLFSYFRYEPNIDRFLIFINCFVISMLFLVSSGNLICFYLGWELIGLSSFFLINFWCTRVGTIKSAFKAYTFNKFSDISLLISILLIIFITYDFNILTLNLQISNYQNKILHILGFDISFIEVVSFFFLISAFIKSAQFGTHIWLPDSMEAPVPASALIHSATLVSAGVFLILRFSPLFELSNYAFYVIGLIGSFTAFFGGCAAAFQSDAKRILAYSTISHCGFLIFSCISKVPEITIYYLYVHGFFKAAVFLCVGNVIHSSYNYQDFRRFGNSIYYLVFEFFFIVVGLINLCGLPFTLGFYMKHFLVLFMIKNFFLFYLILFFIIGGALTGFFYSSRLLFYVFFDFKKGKKYMYIHTNRLIFNNSVFFSKNSLGNNISILYLFSIGSCVSWYYYNIFFNYALNLDSFDLLNLNSLSFFESLNTNLSFLTFISFLNWFFFCIILIVVFFSWRSSIFYKFFFSNFIYLLLFFTFFYFFL